MEYLNVDNLVDCLKGYEKYFAILGAAWLGYKVLKIGCTVSRITARAVRRSFAVDLHKYGRWAVITGSTDGIGKSYALQMAEKGMDIVLISRSPEKLAKTAAEIRQHSKVEVKAIAVDFKSSDIYDTIKKELDGLDIGILVNNVGMVNPHTVSFCEPADFEEYNRSIVNVNILSCVMMTGIVLPEMLGRKRGHIINISSGAGIRPLPYFPIYSASKVFLIFLTEALIMEYRSQGVTFQVVTPNLVRTSMTQTYADALNIREGLFYPSSDTFVRKAIQTIGREPVTGAYWPHEFQRFLIQLFPDWFYVPALKKQRDTVAAFIKKQ